MFRDHKKYFFKSIVLEVLVLFTAFESAAQYRNPAPAEETAITKLVNAVLPVIEGFSDKNWNKLSGGADQPENYSVQKDPDVPLGTAPFNDWQFEIRPNSDLWQEKMQELTEKLQHPPSDRNDKKAWESYQEIGQQIRNLQNIFIEVHVNERSIPVKPVKGAAADLKIPGCFFSYKQEADHLIGTDRNLKNSYVLLFGNWNNAKLDTHSDAYDFQFLHSISTPYVENIVVIITGNDEAIKAQLKKKDWNTINEGLTR